MNRLICAVALPVASLALIAGCHHSKTMTDTAGNAIITSRSAVAVAHMHPAPAASTQPSMGMVTGDVTFKQKDDKLMIHAELTGLPPGNHGIHIHEKGDLSAKDLSSAGGHFDPDMHKTHGAPNMGTMVHAGDLGNITADATGKATFDLTVTDLSVGGKNDIVGRSVIIHAKEDDMHTQPSGASGARIAAV